MGDAGYELCTSAEVLQEIFYRYTALGRVDLADRLYDPFVGPVSPVFSVTLADTDLAKRILLSTAGLSARDIVHAAVMLNRDTNWLATFDQGSTGWRASIALAGQGSRLVRAAAMSHISYASRNPPSSSTVTRRTGLSGVVR